MTQFLSPFNYLLILLQLAMLAGGEDLSRGAIQQIRRHAGEFQKFARPAVTALRHFRQVQKPLLVLQEIGRGLQSEELGVRSEELRMVFF